jgi:HEAT repeat protein
MRRFLAAVTWAGLVIHAGALPARADRVDDLVAALKGPDARARATAAMSLATVKPATPAMVAALGDAALDRDLNVRYYAVGALKGIGPAARSAVPSLVKVLEGTFPDRTPPLEGPARYYADVRSVAAEALGAIGPDAKDALPALRKAAQDPSADVRDAAAEAVRRIGAPPPATIRGRVSGR